MSKNIALRVAGLVFILVAFVHLLRLIYHIPIVLSGQVVPMSVSYIGLIVALVLAIWMLLASRR